MLGVRSGAADLEAGRRNLLQAGGVELRARLVEEFAHPTYTSFPVMAERLLLAAIFGAAIGFEREWRNRPAGIRAVARPEQL